MGVVPVTPRGHPGQPARAGSSRPLGRSKTLPFLRPEVVTVNAWQSCPKCASTDIMDQVTVADRTDSGAASLSLSFPGARILGPLRIPKFVPLVARVCFHCGYSELYAKDPQELRAARDATKTSAVPTQSTYQTTVTEAGSASRPFLLIASVLAGIMAFAIAALVLIITLLRPG
jgi:predicted nucleic-acid-binding Zn-ribbon protein